jgi:hypothetical protein
MIEVESKSNRGALVELITKKIVLENTFSNDLKEKLETEFNLNLNFKVNVSEVKNINGFNSVDIHFEDVDGKILCSTSTIIHKNEITNF